MSSPLQARTLQGFFDYLPEEMLLRQYVKDTWTKIFQKYGYGQLETPALEYADVLKGKYGEEEKLIYQFQDRGGREVALRYDQTVPLARVIAEHQNEIKLPFKRFEINRVWRADAARKARKREFYQCDIDIVGTESLLADAEIITVLHEGFTALGLKNHIISINNRKIINAFIGSLNIPQEKHIEVFRSIDKLDKVGVDGVKEELKKREIPEQAIQKILQYIAGQEGRGEDEEGGVREIEELFRILKMSGVDSKFVKRDPALVRGLDYYTGTIFEVHVPEFGASALAGGGRYDNLCGMFVGKKIPATGVGIGFEPICVALKELNLGPQNQSPSEVLVSVFSKETLGESLKIAQMLRGEGMRTELYLESEKIGKQFQYADKKSIPFVVVIGPDEISRKVVMVKNMKSGEQKEVEMEKVGRFFKESPSIGASKNPSP